MVCIPDIDGGWGSWSSYSACPVTCGNGDRVRTRQCNNPAQSGKGADCPGPSSDVLVCSLSPCAIDGKWATWSSWSSCTKSCSGGKEVRSRTCTNPATNYGGKDCSGDTSEERACNTHACSVCSTGEYLCNDGSCKMGTRCNGVNDCDDASDEDSCSNSVLRMSQGYVNNDLTRPGNTDEEDSGATSFGVSVLLIVGLLSAIFALRV
ncbi:thrombospondin-2-like [Saccostrea cucullata]|uniref:thrombospondin-2-like n=1 Tax=Saccostrea cuccullata TaxID=36930 RepID=UPI002ED222A5